MTVLAPHWEILEWDSGVFGFTVARIGRPESRDALKSAIDNARDSDVRLAYLQTDDREIARDAEALGGLPVSERLTFRRSVSCDAIRRMQAGRVAINVETWHDPSPTADMIQLARGAGHHSRFRLDPNVPTDVFNRIYDAWITNSVNKGIADEVMVVRDGSSVSGLVTVGVKDGRADIGLLSVRAGARGRGIGKALVAAALDWATRHDISEAQVVTQGANAEACALYESCGYEMESAEQVFHFWLWTR